MKTIISVGILISSLVAFAGPEDHVQAQVCYNLSAKQIATKGEHVPLQVCLEDISINTEKNVASIYSYFNQDLFKNVKVSSLIRQTEDKYRFELTSIIHEDWEVICGEGQTVTLKIKGEADFTGAVSKEALTVTVEDEFTNDSCHSPGRMTEYIYSL